MTGDRSGLIGQMSTVFEDRLILRLADLNDWAITGVSRRKEIPSAWALAVR